MDYTLEDITVYYKGKAVTALNPILLKRRGIDRETLEELKLTHEDRARIFESMEATDDPEDLKMFAAQFEALEFEQQRLWGFPQDRNFHRWFDVPKCKCPKMDNADNIGTKYRIITAGCPIHSLEEENKK